MPVVKEQEPTHRCPACDGRMIVFADIEKKHKRDKFNEAEVTYFHCERCGHIQIVKK